MFFDTSCGDNTSSATPLARLDLLGYSTFFAQGLATLATASALPLAPARVLQASREHIQLAGTVGDFVAPIAGKLRDSGNLPTVGDWVAVSMAGTTSARVEAILPRRSCLARKIAGDQTRPQVLAANLDTVFLVMGLDADFNLRRLERLAVLAWDSGALPVLVLTKADLHPEPSLARLDALGAAPGFAAFLVCATRGEGLEPLRAFLGAGQTVAMVGSSGAGKSTLVNALCGAEVMRTGAVRESDHKGQHTTTHRQLVALPTGGLLIDNPGIREVQLWAGDEALEATFDDLQGFAAGCRFGDCRHHEEPGCAVLAAVADGTLDPARLESYRSLQRELQHLERRRDVAAARRAERSFGKMAREAQALKNRGRV
jgi:ribosome biogenesis GTPase